jgi:hypothetical protein
MHQSVYYGSVSSALLNMTAEVFEQRNEQDPDTGEITRRWVFKERIACHIDIAVERGSAITANYKKFDNEYTEEFKIAIKTLGPLSKRYRISNFTNRAGEKLFVEWDQINQPSTIFEIESHHPRLDPLGNLLYFESNIRRLQVQSND